MQLTRLAGAPEKGLFIDLLLLAGQLIIIGYLFVSECGAVGVFC